MKLRLPPASWIWRGLVSLVALVLLAVAGLYVAYLLAYGDIKSWAESESFRHMLSHQVSRALKVHGDFEEITLVEDLTADVTSFESVGRAGEAIGSMNAYDVQATFNPWAIFWSVWEIKRVDIGKGEFKLRLPDDALKQPLSQGKKPWYNFLMPRRFYCGEIVCPDADVIFPFQGAEGRLSGLHLTATMVGQDFKYDCRDGMLDFPYFPKMHVDELKMFITREKADIEKAVLRGVDGDPAEAEISARIGMRDDKSIKADVSLTEMPVAQILPPEWQGKLNGRLNGDIIWNTDETGKKIQANGKVKLTASELKQWSWLDELARVHGNQDLQSFMFEQVSTDFDIKNNELTAQNLHMVAPGSFILDGSGSYNWENGTGSVHFDIRELPLSKWMPAEVKAKVDGMAQASLKWSGKVEDSQSMTASGKINLNQARVSNPVRFQSILAPHGINLPQEVEFTEAHVLFQYELGNFAIEDLYMATKDVGRLSFDGSWTVDDRLRLKGSVVEVDLKRWMKDSTRQDIHGELWISGDWSCSRWDLEKGTGEGWLGLEGGCFRGWGLQKTLVRFLKDESWLTIEVEPVKVNWVAKNGNIALKSIDIFSPGKMGLSGFLRHGADHSLSGTIWIGLHEKNLTWLPGAKEHVFTKNERGLHWMKVTMSGTVEKPEHDMDDQIRRQLLKHPFALIGLGLRGVSWWAGDVLGTYEEPVVLPKCRR